MPPRSSASHGDLNAKNAERLRAEQDAADRQRAEDLLARGEAEALAMDQVIDMTGGNPVPVVVSDEPILVGEESATYEVRLNTDIEDMTVGAGTFYTFERGKKYRVTRHIRDHLESLDLLWH